MNWANTVSAAVVGVLLLSACGAYLTQQQTLSVNLLIITALFGITAYAKSVVRWAKGVSSI